MEPSPSTTTKALSPTAQCGSLFSLRRKLNIALSLSSVSVGPDLQLVQRDGKIRVATHGR